MVILFSSQMAFGQGGAKWTEHGNPADSTSWMGTTTPFPIIWKVNNLEKMSLSTTGQLQLNALQASGTGIAWFDSNGNLMRTNFPNDPNQVLTGNGTFATFSSLGGWEQHNNNLYNTNTGYVGIGTNFPQYKLDVNGNMRVNGIIYAQGLVLATKMMADTMKSPKMIADTLKSAGVLAGTIRSTGMISINDNLNFSGGAVNEIYTMNGDVRLQSNPGFGGNTILNGGANGNVGVGTFSPQYKMDVNGDARVNGKMYVNRIVALPGDSIIRFGDSTIYLNTSQNYLTATPNGQILGMGIGFGINHHYGINSISIGSKIEIGAQGFNTILIGSGVINGPKMSVNIPNSLMVGFNSTIPTFFVGPANGMGTTGGVCIGDTYIPDGYKLAVNGKIIAEEVQVTLRGFWPDTVFSPSYELMPLAELEAYVNREQHLPGVPSAKQMQGQKNFGLGEMEVILLQKTEEQTLYIIELQKQMDAMQMQMDAMKKEVEEMKRR